jgi:hypothetical protein
VFHAAAPSMRSAGERPCSRSGVNSSKVDWWSISLDAIAMRKRDGGRQENSAKRRDRGRGPQARSGFGEDTRISREATTKRDDARWRGGPRFDPMLRSRSAREVAACSSSDPVRAAASTAETLATAGMRCRSQPAPPPREVRSVRGTAAFRECAGAPRPGAHGAEGSHARIVRATWARRRAACASAGCGTSAAAITAMASQHRILLTRRILHRPRALSRRITAEVGKLTQSEPAGAVDRPPCCRATHSASRIPGAPIGHPPGRDFDRSNCNARCIIEAWANGLRGPVFAPSSHCPTPFEATPSTDART